MVAQSELYIHATIITVNQRRDIPIDGAIHVVKNRIVAVGPTQDLLVMADPSNTHIVDLEDKIVIPGLINTHAHTAQSLLRGLAEEMDLHDWLCSAIWPLEASFAGTDGYIAAKLTMAEMLKSGTTTFLEAMLTHRAGWDNVVRAVEESGMRACLGKLVKPKETNSATGMIDARDKDVDAMSLDAALEAHISHHGLFEDRLHVWLALGTPRGSDPSFHREAAEAANARGMGITMHCAEAPRDLEIYQQSYNCSPMEFCKDNKIAGQKTVLAHMVNLDLAKDIALLEETGTSVAHNPSSNCKLGSGVASVPDMLAGGVNVALGTDGAPCANSYDMIREMNIACLLQSGVHQKAGILPATSALEMATINAAKALGLEDEVGSLEPGKKADFVVLDPYSIGSAATPWDTQQYVDGGMDPVTVVVHSCTGRDVDMVVVDGAVLVEDGKLTRVDEKELMNEAKVCIKGIRGRSGVRSRMKLWEETSLAS